MILLLLLLLNNYHFLLIIHYLLYFDFHFEEFQKIKYIYFIGYFLNRVGDKCNLGNGTVWKARGIGPIESRPLNLEELNKDYTMEFYFDKGSFYSYVADSFVLSSVTIEYFDKTKILLTGEKLKKCIIF